MKDNFVFLCKISFHLVSSHEIVSIELNMSSERFFHLVAQKMTVVP